MRDPGGGLVPPGALFGATVAGYRCEGGFNAPGEPANQWWAWERSGRAVPSGTGGDFWPRPGEALDRAAEAGCEVLAVPVEWARVERAPGCVDPAVLDRYAELMSMCTGRGLVPIVTLHGVAHPAWLGDEFWLTPGSPDRFADHVSRVVGRLGTACRHWLTLHEPNLVALAGWVGGHRPPGRVGAVADAWAVLDNLLAAHVLAYEAIHGAQPQPYVAMGIRASDSYEWHRLPVDLLMARHLGIERSELDAWVEERRVLHDLASPPANLVDLVARRAAAVLSPFGGSGEAAGPGPGPDAVTGTAPDAAREWLTRRIRARTVRWSPRRAVDLVYARTGGAPLDALVVTWSPPPAGARARPVLAERLARLTAPTPQPWEMPPDLDGLVRWCRDQQVLTPGLPLWVEGGFAIPADGSPRADGWDRRRYLRAALRATVTAADDGATVAGFLYRDLGGATDATWPSADYGLFAVEPAPGVREGRGGGVRWRETDGSGIPAGESFRALVAAVRSGDRSALTDLVPARAADASDPPGPRRAVSGRDGAASAPRARGSARRPRP